MHEHNQQLDTYIQEQLRAGYSLGVIQQTLIQHGWDSQAVGQAVSRFGGHGASVVSPAAASQHKNPVRSPGNVDVSSKYRLFTAVGDAIRAIKANITTFAISYIVTIILVGIANLLIGAFILGLFFSNGLIGFGGVGRNIFIGIVFMIFMFVYYGFLHAFMINMLSLPLFSGRESPNSSVGSVLQRAVRKIPKVALAVGATYLVAGLPIIVMVLLAVVSLISGQTGILSSPALVAVFSLVSLIWVIIALLRYSLTPFVALYEDRGVIESLKRSNHLLKNGGQWFLVKGIVLLIVFLVIYSILTGNTLQDVQSIGTVAGSILLLLIDLLANSVLVMLYINRRAIKGDV